MTLVKKDAGAPPARRTNGMPVTVDPKPWMAIPGLALLVIGMLLGAYGHGLDPAGTGELAALQWLHERRTGFLTFVTETLELVGGPMVVPWLLLGMLVLLLALRRVIMALTAVLLPGIGWLPGHLPRAGSRGNGLRSLSPADRAYTLECEEPARSDRRGNVGVEPHPGRSRSEVQRVLAFGDHPLKAPS